MRINRVRSLYSFFSSPTELGICHYQTRVTGGGTGVRKAIAQEFAKEGAKVTMRGKLTNLRELVESGILWKIRKEG